jgi:sugar phosphate permease
VAASKTCRAWFITTSTRSPSIPNAAAKALASPTSPPLLLRPTRQNRHTRARAGGLRFRPVVKLETSTRARRERRVLVLLVAAYASLYLCRANIEPAFTMLSVQHGYDNEQTGTIFAIALAAYAVGKVLLGMGGDLLGGKTILVIAMGTAVVASLLVGVLDWPTVVGARSALWIMGSFVVLNRFGQSGGWGGIVHVVSRWFPAERSGAVMGIASTSYDVGNVAALLLCAGLVRWGAGWRSLFLVNPLLLAIVTLLVVFGLRGKPPHAEATPAERAEAAVHDEKEPLRSLLRRLFKERGFWMAVILSFLLTFVRAGFMTWTPRYLYDVATAAGSTTALSGSIAKSAFFGVAGMMGSLVIGRLSDRWGPGRRAGIMTASLGALLLAVLALAHAHVTDALGAAGLIGLAGLFLLGPYSLLAGAITLDVAGKRGASTTAGIVDGVGYAGASLAAIVLGSVSKRHGWSAAFDVIAAVTLVALLLTATWWRKSRPATREASAG